MLYLLLLMPLAAVGIWTSVRVSNAAELAYFIGFFVFSAGAVRPWLSFLSVPESNTPALLLVLIHPTSGKVRSRKVSSLYLQIS